MNDGQAWFLEKQRQIAGRVGEPVLLTIKMAFDTWFEVEINTFTGQMGMAAGEEVEIAIDEAVEMLLEMDEIIAEIEHKRLPGHVASGESEEK